MRDITRQMRLQEWAEQIEDWRRSGLTQRQWAKAHGMTLEGSFMSPASQIVQLPAPGAVEEYARTQEQTPIHYCSIEINMPEGSIRVSSDIKPEVLQMLIREVKNA